MKTIVILMLLLSLGACKKSDDSGASKNPTPPPNNPTPEPPDISCSRSVQSTGFNGGDGSESSPYMICTYAQLNKMRENLMAHYELGQDINANPSWSAGDNGCTAYDGSTVPETTPCTGWVPVGTFETDKCDGETDDVCFQGHLDGGDHIISNLYLNISSSGNIYSGLFGYTGSQAKIFNMGLTNASVTVTSSDRSSHGGRLIGYNSGTISNSYATGEVDTSSFFSSHGGGLIGYNSGTISNSYATGEVVEHILRLLLLWWRAHRV